MVSGEFGLAAVTKAEDEREGEAVLVFRARPFPDLGPPAHDLTGEW